MDAMAALLREALTTALFLATAPLAALWLLLLWPALQILEALRWLMRLPYATARGKVVVITGASSGIGQHLAYEYAKRGAALTLAARRQERLDRTAEQCRRLGALDAMTCRTDVSKEEDCKRLIDVTMERYGRIDVLVNNAGTTESGLFEQCADVNDLKKTMDVDFWGNVWPTVHALPYLRESNGQIVVTASVGGYLTYPRQAMYNAAKAAIIQFYDTLRVEAEDGIAITIVMPGFIVSELTTGAPPDHIPKWWPMMATEEAAKHIASAAVMRKRYTIVPRWYSAWLFYRLFASEVPDWSQRMLLLGQAPNKLVKDVADVLLGEGSLERLLRYLSPTGATMEGR